MTSFPFSKVMSGASAAYAVYALVRPAHLGRALESKPESAHDTTARVFGVRDLVTSTVALVASDPRTITAAMASRVAFDIGDCLTLRPLAGSGESRTKLTAVTLGWAAINSAAYLIDRARGRSQVL